MDIFSNLQVVGECLLDRNRVKAYETALNEVVKPGNTVIDCGTGSGIMALLAARAGAAKVFAVEIAEDVAQFAKNNIKASPFRKIIQVHNADIKDVKFSEKIDVVVAEMLDTGLVSEQQAQAMNRLHELGIVNEATIFVPYAVECAVEAVEYNFDFYGFNMPFVIQARNYGAYEHCKKLLSKTAIYSTVDFRKPVDTNVDETTILTIKKEGVFNAIRLKTKTLLSPKTKVWGTSDMNMPVVIPITARKVKAGDIIKLRIKYQMGEGFGNFTVETVD